LSRDLRQSSWKCKIEAKMSSQELLVVLEPHDAQGYQQTLADTAHARVTQIASSRLVVLEAESSAISALAALPGVEGVYEAPVPDEVIKRFGESEALFVRAWQMRQQQSRGERRGEGLDWDAEGFEPP
jgi:hypothetical protein